MHAAGSASSCTTVSVTLEATSSSSHMGVNTRGGSAGGGRGGTVDGRPRGGTTAPAAPELDRVPPASQRRALWEASAAPFASGLGLRAGATAGGASPAAPSCGARRGGGGGGGGCHRRHHGSGCGCSHGRQRLGPRRQEAPPREELHGGDALNDDLVHLLRSRGHWLHACQPAERLPQRNAVGPHEAKRREVVEEAGRLAAPAKHKAHKELQGEVHVLVP
mmetsp:Transcript_1398/g.4438  ORF Transcript_1398/g.4438 Transcript_1398/m.4438 type:complete len:220 (+) Transcript_1398:725-1384(+)